MTRYLAVDDEKPALDYLVRQLESVEPDAEVVTFLDPKEALAYATENTVDIAFLDIEMYGLNGIELARRFKDVQPGLSIIFVTGFTRYAVEAFSVHACGYLLKPASKEALRTEIEVAKLRMPIRPKKRIYVQTFGNFEILIDGISPSFKRRKSKELLAYLIDRRGAAVNVQEVLAALYEDKDPDEAGGSLVRTLVADMMHALSASGADGLVEKRRNSLSLNVDMVDCDYYRFLDGDTTAINAYCGEYMVNYSWAEFTTGVLDSKANLY